MNNFRMERRSLIASGLGVSSMLALLGSAEARPQAQGPRATTGLRLLERLGAAQGPDIAALSPDLARLHAEAVAEHLERPVLPLKARMQIAVATLIVQPAQADTLKRHMMGMLRAGASPVEIIETVFQSVVYAGFPPAQAAMLTARELFQETGTAFQSTSARPKGDHWRLGVAQLAQTGGDDALGIVQEALDGTGLAPDFDRWIVEFAHGELWNRPGLPMRDRELATLAMVIANGNASDLVRFHAEACLRTGWTRDQVAEVLIQMAMLVGWPLALTAVDPMLAALREAEAGVGLAPPGPLAADLAARSSQRATDDALYQRGVEALQGITAAAGESVLSAFDDIAPDLSRYIFEFSYGVVFSRPGLDLKSRELATVAALAARGTSADEVPLKAHVVGALNTGADRTEIIEAILHMIPYAGFNRVQTALRLADEAFDEADG